MLSYHSHTYSSLYNPHCLSRSTMEALSFLKFWKPTNTTTPTHKQTQISADNSNSTNFPNILVDSDCDFDQDEEDSFFELELSVSDFQNKNRVPTTEETKQLKVSNKTSSDVLSRRKILPMEPSSKPQSPIAMLKSAPKLRVSFFKNSKTMAAERKTDSLRPGSQEKDLFSVKFRVEEVQNHSVFTKSRSLRKTQELNGSYSSSSFDNENMSKRFSKDAIQKYLNKIKPLYVKSSKKNENVGFSSDMFSEASPASSPAVGPMPSPRKDKKGNKSTGSGFRAASKHLGKSKSVASAISSPARRDDSLLLQHDGIQSAILHCKRSFNSSRDCSLLPRSTSGSSHETLSNLSSSDSSLLSRFSSDSSSSISARKSSEE